MPPPRPATEVRSGSLEPGRQSRADQPIRAIQPAGCTRHPPTDRMYATDVRQTDVRQHHCLMPPGRGIKIRGNIGRDMTGIGIRGLMRGMTTIPKVTRSY